MTALWRQSGQQLRIVESQNQEANQKLVLFDVPVLLECAIPVRDLLAALNEADGPIFHHAPNLAEAPEEAIKIFTRFAPEFLAHTIRHLKLPMRTSVLLAVLHLPSKLHRSDDSQALAAERRTLPQASQ